MFCCENSTGVAILILFLVNNFVQAPLVGTASRFEAQLPEYRIGIELQHLGVIQDAAASRRIQTEKRSEPFTNRLAACVNLFVFGVFVVVGVRGVPLRNCL